MSGRMSGRVTASKLETEFNWIELSVECVCVCVFVYLLSAFSRQSQSAFYKCVVASGQPLSIRKRKNR